MSEGWHVLRFIIEANSPISCTTGNEGFNDTQLVRDANDLPMIPGPTLQGVFRSFCDEKTAKNMFGWFEVGTNGKKGVAHPGKLFFSNALVLGADGKCAGPNQIISKGNATDLLFMQLLDDAPLKREHVKINELGAADGSQKYDRSAVPKGTRFAFEVMMMGTEDEKNGLIEIFKVFRSPFLRFGGRGRRGYGKVELLEAKYGFFEKGDFAAFRGLRQTELSDLSDLVEDVKTAINTVACDTLTISLNLSNINPWRIGGDGVRTRVGKRRGKDDLVGDPDVKEAKFASTREPEIKWSQETINGKQQGSWAKPSPKDLEKFVLYGTSLAGPLAHRTLFHYNCLSGNFIDFEGEGLANSLKKLAKSRENQRHLKSLFGEAADDQVGEAGMASALFIDDIEIVVGSTMTVDHISIDRFTGGVRQGMLFDEELIVTSKVAVNIHIDPRRWKMPETSASSEFERNVRVAFCMALRDLSFGALALGAKSYGYFDLETPPVFSGSTSQVWQNTFNDPKSELNLLEDAA
jgi:CRISPR/Cas system CSM-associated protein Csm3 (group 7 of RAMP superfamily)